MMVTSSPAEQISHVTLKMGIRSLIFKDMVSFFNDPKEDGDLN